MTPNVVVVGSANMDLVVRAQRAPWPGETVQGRSLDYLPGGKGANQAVAAARLGARTHMVCRVGDDSLGEPVRRNLADNGVDVSRVRIAAGAPQGLAIIIVDDEGQNRIVLAAGSNGMLVPDDIDWAAAVFSPDSLVLLQNEIRLETTIRAAQVAKAAGATVLWNPAPAPDSLPDEMIGCVDVLLPNESEAESLTGIAVHDSPGAHRAAAAIVAKGIPNVVITLGERGALWFNEDEVFELPSFPVSVVDTTAAGDTFAGALAVALAEGRESRDAVRFACGASALAVTKLGAQPGIPTRAQLEAFLAER
ncbi:MAG TPA: ribokinase [Armatimonadota bacterium]|jgi:ribokinase